MIDKTRIINWDYLRGEIAKCASPRIEPVKLAGGAVTHEYLDLKSKFSNGAIMHSVAVCLLDYHRKLKLPGFDAIGGPTMGADVISHAVAMDERLMHWFSVRDEQKDHGLQRLIEGVQLDEWHHVLLIDDTVSTGSSLLKAYNAVREIGCTVVAVMPVVDRAGVAKFRFNDVPYRPLFTHDDLGLKPL
jgi:orotate phosphoribosyltransferase